MEMKIFKCKKCGKMVEMVKGSACPTMCCGDAMVELKAGSTDAAVEKHVPVVTKNGNLVEVSVGSVAHPMTEEHLIEWVALQTRQGLQKKSLKAGEAPKVVFALTDGDEVEKAYAYCNLHGLWASN